MKVTRKFVLVIGLAVVAALLPWALSFADPAPEQDNCSFNSITNAEYRQLLGQAKARPWTVWPSLSNGIFWPSDRGVLPPSAAVESAAGDWLLRSVRQLAPEGMPPGRDLASVHAVMRSIHAEYVSVWNVPDFRQDGRLVRSHVYFNYFMPQVRLAPLCLPCLVWSETNFRVVFVHDVAADTYALSQIIVLNSNFKSDLKRERNIQDGCPSFPKPSQESKT